MAYEIQLSGTYSGQSGGGGGFAVTLPLERCETWDITKYTDAGKFKNTWKGDVDPGVTREVGFGIEVYVHPDDPDWPMWWIYYGYTTEEDWV